MRSDGCRRVFQLVCLLLGMGAICGGQSIDYRLTPDHAASIVSPGMFPPLSTKWSVDLGTTLYYPIIVGNRVFVIGRTRLFALDAGTGNVLWSQTDPQNGGTWSGFAYDNGVLFALSSLDGLFAFSAIDGHQIWSASLTAQREFTATPTIFNGVIYLHGHGYGGSVFAIRESDGALLWTEYDDQSDSNPAVTSDGVYVSFSCNTLDFDASGNTIWHVNYECSGGYGATVAVYRGLVYALHPNGYQTSGITLNAANGSYVAGFDTAYAPAFWQNTVFYTEPNALVADDLDNSLPQWVAVPDSGDSYSCAPIAVNGIVYTATTRGRVYGYSADTGSKVFGENTGLLISCPETPQTPSIGINAADGLLVVPAGTHLVAYKFDHFGKWQFVPSTPCRLVDTRQTHNPIQAGTSQNFNIPQLGGCGIPSTATAYSLNVTAVPHGSSGYLTVWPAGETQPTVSNMNSPDGRVKANAAIVPAGFQDNVSVYASDTTDVILDVNGYFTPPASGTYQFYPLPPCRIVDTRNGQDQGTLQAGHERDYTIAGNCGVPSTAVAYSFNVTVLPTQGSLDYLTVWPKGESRPTVSTLNDNTGTVLANAAIVPAGTLGTTAFYAHNHNTDLLLDVNGYFAPPGQGGLSLYPTTPCRVLDTRSSGGQFQGEKTVGVTNSICAPPPTAQAYVFNATVVPPGSLPYLTLWPDGQNQPTVSTLNAGDGAITSNLAIVSSTNGSIDAYAAGLTQLILDINGYFAP